MARYLRSPSPAFTATLKPGGLLAPLLVRRVVSGLPLDVHLRESDHIHVYCGGTRLVDAWLAGGRVRVTAHETYLAQECGGRLFRDWELGDQGFGDAADAYLSQVAVNPSYVRGEGAVQATWASVHAPWIPFDREATLGYVDAREQTASRAIRAVAEARSEVERAKEVGGWAAMKETGGELDQLAVDPSGRLVLLELKDAGASPYYAPLQLLQYVHEWAAALEVVRPDLDALIESRIALGLSPRGMPKLTTGIRPIVAFGADGRSDEVRARFEAVLAIVNRYLPAGAPPIEVWSLAPAPLR